MANRSTRDIHGYIRGFTWLLAVVVILAAIGLGWLLGHFTK